MFYGLPEPAPVSRVGIDLLSIQGHYLGPGIAKEVQRGLVDVQKVAGWGGDKDDVTGVLEQGAILLSTLGQAGIEAGVFNGDGSLRG